MKLKKEKIKVILIKVKKSKYIHKKLLWKLDTILNKQLESREVKEMDFVVLEKNGLRKEVKVGFSWTVFFFGLFVPLFRGDLKWAAIMFFGTILLGFATLGIGGAVLGIVMSFVYNKIYIKDLIEKGWNPVGEENRLLLEEKNIIGK